MIKHFYLSNKPLIVLLLNSFIIVITYYGFLRFGIINGTPNESNIIRYDAGWFEGIRQSGYTYAPDQMSNIAFFPLFPYLWKFTGLTGLQISFFNLFVFMGSFILLLGKTQYKFRYLLIVSSLPCFIFFFLPYSEAYFFFFGTLLILGYRKNSRTLQFIGILGCCLTRSVSTFFIPAIVVTELLAYKSSGISKMKLLINIITQTLICFGSILIVVLVQGLQTGKWFYYIEVQKYWQRHWLFPSFPLTTISPNKVLGIDSVAFVLGIIAIFFCFKWAIEFLVFKKCEQKKVQGVCKSVYFSALFLAAIVIVDTCFTYNVQGRTNIQCMNRHLMCTSFAICFLNWLNRGYKLNLYDVRFIAGILISGIFITSVLSYGHHTIYYVLFCGSFFLYRFFPILRHLFLVLFLFNIFLIVIFYHDFINGFWIG